MEILVLLGVSVLLLLVEPIGAILIISLLGFTGWAFNKLTRKHILIWGEKLQLHEGLRIQHLQQGLGGAKDVKLLGRENEFLDQYALHNAGSAHMSRRQSILLALPRLILEFFAVIALVSLVIVLINKGKSIDLLLPIIGLFAAAAFRLLPSVNRVIGAVQLLRFTSPIANTLYDEIHLIHKTESISYEGEVILKNNLEIKNVRFSYPSSELEIIKDININIIFGKTVGFIGESGAGKSTLVDIILGLLTPVSGEIIVDGINITKSIRGWQNQIGYVPQSIYLVDDSLRRNIAFGLPIKDISDDAVWQAARSAKLEEFINKLPDGLETIVGERGVKLSGGQQQRIGIARALYHNPSVLVLDEATSSLDIETERKVMDAVNELHGEKTILIVAHRLSTVESCDYIYRLEQGKIISEGTPEVMLRSHDQKNISRSQSGSGN